MKFRTTLKLVAASIAAVGMAAAAQAADIKFGLDVYKRQDFRNVIVIMTTNAGAETWNRPSIGFANSRVVGDEMAEIRRMFTPEFRNRLDAIIPFAPLDREIILRCV